MCTKNPQLNIDQVHPSPIVISMTVFPMVTHSHQNCMGKYLRCYVPFTALSWVERRKPNRLKHKSIVTSSFRHARISAKRPGQPSRCAFFLIRHTERVCVCVKEFCAKDLRLNLKNKYFFFSPPIQYISISR